MEYEKMLDRLYASLPEKAKQRERFEMPVVESHIQGNKTVVNNFKKLFTVINRPEKHLFKFIAKEMATAASLTEGRLYLNGKFTNQQVNKLFTDYLKQYVICAECGKPDTKLVDHKGVKSMKCEACGATHPVRRL